MALSQAEQKREQKRQALRNAGLDETLTWADMTSEQRALYHSASMRLYHQRKGNGHQDGEELPPSTTIRTRKAPSKSTPSTPSTPVEPLPKWVWYAVGGAFATVFGVPLYLAWKYKGN